MFLVRRIASALFLASGLSIALVGTGAAATYPDRPIKVIVPFAAGGGTDLTARIIQKAVEADGSLHEPLTIINVPGAAGAIGARQVMQAKPDGYTILLDHTALLIGQASGMANFGYKDFTPIATTIDYANILAVPADSPYKTLPQLLDAAAKKPDSIVMGVNLGGNTHMIAMMLQKAHKGAKLRVAQTGGDATSYTALAGHQIDLAAFSLSSYASFAGQKIRPLAMLSDKRWPTLPKIPTATEEGVPVSFEQNMYWLAPKNTPHAIVEKLAVALKKAMQNPDLKKNFEKRNTLAVYYGPKKTGEQMAKWYAKLAPYAKAMKR